jgi:hypothetical protein
MAASGAALSRSWFLLSMTFDMSECMEPPFIDSWNVFEMQIETNL